MQYVDCDRAEKHGSLCLGYGWEEIDEPCEQCKNCIKCEGGYYQLGETEKDDRIEKLQEVQQALGEDKCNLQEDLFRVRKRTTELEEQIEKLKCCQNCADGKSCENSGLVYVCEKWRFEK